MKKLKYALIALFVLITLSCSVLFYLVSNTLIATVPSSSMEDAIAADSKIIGNPQAYKNNLPERYDIIIFQHPDIEDRNLQVKRIIGLPGEKMEIIDGKVYINDSDVTIDEDYIKNADSGNYGPYEIPDGCYFVLGDNRNMSFDSRHWVNTYVSEDMILAKVINVIK